MSQEAECAPMMRETTLGPNDNEQSNDKSHNAPSTAAKGATGTTLDERIRHAEESSRQLEEAWKKFQNLGAQLSASLGKALTNMAPTFGVTLEQVRAAKEEYEAGQPAVGPAIPFSSFDIAGVANSIRQAKNILVVVGAGISVAAGFMAFRNGTSSSPSSPSHNGGGGGGMSSLSSFYSKLEKYVGNRLTSPESFFTPAFIYQNPEMFYQISAELGFWDTTKKSKATPTATHALIKSLSVEKKLAGCITQNIDSLEFAAGVPRDEVIQAHGSFDSASCFGDKKHSVAVTVIHDAIEKKTVPRCPICNSIVRPDVVLFGEPLPADYRERKDAMVRKADLLLVIGTSMRVFPVSALPTEVNKDCPRVLINMERVGEEVFRFLPSDDQQQQDGDAHTKKTMPSPQEREMVRDVFLGGDCQKTCQLLAEELSKKKPVILLPQVTAATAVIAPPAATKPVRRSPPSAASSKPSCCSSKSAPSSSSSSTVKPPRTGPPACGAATGSGKRRPSNATASTAGRVGGGGVPRTSSTTHKIISSLSRSVSRSPATRTDPTVKASQSKTASSSSSSSDAGRTASKKSLTTGRS